MEPNTAATSAPDTPTQILGKRAFGMIQSSLINYSGRNSITPGCKDGHVGALLSHRALAGEFHAFLQTMGISQVWTTDPYNWFVISKLYSEIVRDCPLEINRKDYQFPYISKLEVIDCEPFEEMVKANPGPEHIGWTWKFTLSDGRTFNMGNPGIAPGASHKEPE